MNRDNFTDDLSEIPLSTVALISDLHIGSQQDLTLLENAIKQAVTGNKATALIIPGDLSDANHEKKEIYDTIKNNIPAQQRHNVIVTLGNHDIRWSGLPNKKIDPHLLSQYKETIHDVFSTSFTEGTNCFDKTIDGYYYICLNSDTGEKDEIHLSMTSFEWLESKLDAYIQAFPYSTKPFFVVMHEPLRDTHWRSDSNIVPELKLQDTRFKQLFSRYPHLIIINGHIHNGFGAIEFMQRPFGTLVEVPSLTRQENGDIRYEKGTGWLMKLYTDKVVFEAWNFTEKLHHSKFDQTILLPQLSVVTDQLQRQLPQLPVSESIVAKALLEKAHEILGREYQNTTDGPDRQSAYGVSKIFDESTWKEINTLQREIRPLLKKETIMTNISDVASISNFSLTFVGAERATGAVIFANNENKVAVNVSVDLFDKDRNPVLLTASDFLSKIALYSATGGEDTELDWMTKPDKLHLRYSRYPGDYLGPVQFMGTDVLDANAEPVPYGTGNNNYTLYIYAKPGVAESSTVYARLNSLNKENFSEGFVDTYHSRFSQIGASKITIQCLKQINYSESSYWELDTMASAWRTSKRVKVESKNTSGAWLDTENDAMHSHRKVYVRMKQPTSLPARHIVKREITGSTFGSNKNAGSFYTNSVSADYGYGRYAQEYNKITWWVEPALEGRHTSSYKWIGYQGNGQYILFRQYPDGTELNPLFRTWVDDDLSIATDNVINDAITLYSWRLNIPAPHLTAEEWSNIANDAVVTVYDQYGNTGTFTISFPTDDVIPGLHF